MIDTTYLKKEKRNVYTDYSISEIIDSADLDKVNSLSANKIQISLSTKL